MLLSVKLSSVVGFAYKILLLRISRGVNKYQWYLFTPRDRELALIVY